MVSLEPEGISFTVAAPCFNVILHLQMLNAVGEPVFEFGVAHRNSVFWSPHGRFLCLGGFGNMSGGMDFWDRNKLRMIGSTKVRVVFVVVVVCACLVQVCIAASSPFLRIDAKCLFWGSSWWGFLVLITLH